MPFRKEILLFIALFSTIQANAQLNTLAMASSVHIDSTSYTVKSDKKDILDIWHKYHHKKVEKPQNPDKRLFFSIIPLFGYAITTGFTIGITNSISLYLDKNDHQNRSSIFSQVFYTQKNQFNFISNSYIWSPKKNYSFIGDYRLYKYETSTFGLGSHTQSSDEVVIDYNHVRVYQAGLKRINDQFFAGVGYNLDYHWGISSQTTAEVNQKQNLLTDDIGSDSKTISTGLSLHLLYDNREKSKNGTYFYTRFIQNTKLLGSNSNWKSLLLEAKQFVTLSEKHHQSLGFWTYNWLTLDGTAPYLDMPSTGWDAYNNMGRGYAVGRFRGRNLLYLESEFRFGLTKSGILGGVVFANAQSISESSTNHFETLLPGAGAGIRLQLNKKTNSVLSIDYAVGRYGSRGFFFNLSEVF